MASTNPPGTFTKNQVEALTLLAAGAATISVARVLGVHRTTINHWMRENPEFKKAVEQAREDASTSRRERLLESIDLSLDYIEEVIQNPEISHTVRLRAAFQLLRLAPSRQALTTPAQPVQAEPAQEVKAKPQVAAQNSSHSSLSSPRAAAEPAPEPNISLKTQITRVGAPSSPANPFDLPVKFNIK